MSIDPYVLDVTSWWQATDMNQKQHIPENPGEIWKHTSKQYILTIDKASHYRNDYWQVYILENTLTIANFASMFVSRKYGWSRIA